MSPSATHDPPRRRLLTVTGVTGIAFTLSWIAGLSVAAPSPKLTASGAEITAASPGTGPRWRRSSPSPRGCQPPGWPSCRSPWPGLRAGPERSRPPGSPASPGLRPRSSRWPSSCSAVSGRYGRSRCGAPALCGGEPAGRGQDARAGHPRPGRRRLRGCCRGGCGTPGSRSPSPWPPPASPTCCSCKAAPSWPMCPGPCCCCSSPAPASRSAPGR